MRSCLARCRTRLGLPATAFLIVMAGPLDCSAGPARPELSIGPSGDNHRIDLRGPDARQQIFVTSRAGDRDLDVTQDVTLTGEPPGLFTIVDDGVLVPLRDGDGTLRAETPDGALAEISVRISQVASNRQTNFPNQIVPIFTRHGCNGGGCHGKSGGQNGFRLSLLGFYPVGRLRVPGERRPRASPVSSGSRRESAAAEGHRRNASRRRCPHYTGERRVPPADTLDRPGNAVGTPGGSGRDGHRLRAGRARDGPRFASADYRPRDLQ